MVDNEASLNAALRLRGLVFRHGRDDRDCIDDTCDHIIVTDVSNGRVIACARALVLPNGAEIHASYAAQFYDLTKLSKFSMPMLELGRFCVHSDHPNGEVLRVFWGALTRLVDAHGVKFLFGCASFPGATVAGRGAAFRLLADQHLAPAHFMPGTAAPDTVGLRELAVGRMDTREALRNLPPLLRTYLSMGAWVGDHAVIDKDLDTLHVFTGLETRAIPEARKRMLRALG
jgi:putative hemolysin